MRNRWTQRNQFNGVGTVENASPFARASRNPLTNKRAQLKKRNKSDEIKGNETERKRTTRAVGKENPVRNLPFFFLLFLFHV